MVSVKKYIYLSRVAATVETDDEKWNIGQMCHALVCRRIPNRLKHYALNISGTFRHRKLKFYSHLDGSTTLFGYENFIARGRARGAAPLVKIWDTLYISETIRARKSKILQHLGSVKYSFRM